MGKQEITVLLCNSGVSARSLLLVLSSAYHLFVVLSALAHLYIFYCRSSSFPSIRWESLPHSG